MKRSILIPFALVGLAACADQGTLTAPAPTRPAADQNVVNGPTYVTGTYLKQVGGTQYVLTSGSAGGSCRDASGVEGSNGPYWYNSQGHRTSAGDHFCVLATGGAGSETITCTFQSTATFAQNPNDNLNFDLIQSAVPGATDLFVHYTDQPSTTTGKGTLAFTAACTDGTTSTTEQGTLDLAQFSATGDLFQDFQDSSLDSSQWYSMLGTSGVKVSVGTSSYDLTGFSWGYRLAAGS